MARIRTFKPEFFRSPDTAKASPRARLLYMALWSWADDEGIGETNIYGLLGFAFPDTDNLTAEELQSLLKEIRGSYGVLFYECRGRFYYAIPTWDSHQKTERRAKARFPKPDDPESVPDLRFGTSEDLRGNSSGPQGRSPLGTGEQGNRGTDHVGATQVPHLGGHEACPPRKCDRHTNTPNPPDCGGCAQANRERTAWQQRQARREADELEAKRAAKAAAAQALIDCRLCDDAGWLLTSDGLPVEPAVKCDHRRPAMPDPLADLKARQEAARRARAHNPDIGSTAHLQAAAIANCGLCDADGYHGTQVCDHVDYAAAAKRGIAKVRQALTKPPQTPPPRQ